MRQVLPKGFLSAIYHLVIKYLPCSSAGICPQVHRASLEWELHQRRPFYTKHNGGPDGKHSHLVPDRWPSNLNYFQHCSDVQAARITLLFKGGAIFMKLDAPFSFVVSLGILHYYGECPCVGKLSPVTLRTVPEQFKFYLQVFRVFRWIAVSRYLLT